MAIRYWLGVVSRDHVQIGVRLGIAQLNHGLKGTIGRLNASDGLIYYSPKTSYPDGEPLREFTAIGRVADDDVFQPSDGTLITSSSGESYRPWRRRVDYDLDAVPVPIRPLTGMLELTAIPNWGYALRRGLVELSRYDFDLIQAQMRRRVG